MFLSQTTFQRLAVVLCAVVTASNSAPQYPLASLAAPYASAPHASSPHASLSHASSPYASSPYASSQYASAPSAAAPSVPIVNQVQEVSPDGSFKNSFQAGNGISVDENGYVKNSGSGEPVQVIQGVNQYTAPDGSVIQTGYIADENGFQPSGSHLPTPPTPNPIILKSLEWLASQPSTPAPSKYGR